MVKEIMKIRYQLTGNLTNIQSAIIWHQILSTVCSHCSKNKCTYLIVRHNKFKKIEWTNSQTILLKCDEYSFFQ